MGGFYSHPLAPQSPASPDKENRGPSDENLPKDNKFNSSTIQGKTPQNNDGPLVDPRSPNPTISRTPILVTQNKDQGVNPLKGKVLGFPKSTST